MLTTVADGKETKVKKRKHFKESPKYNIPSFKVGRFGVYRKKWIEVKIENRGDIEKT